MTTSSTYTRILTSTSPRSRRRWAQIKPKNRGGQARAQAMVVFAPVAKGRMSPTRGDSMPRWTADMALHPANPSSRDCRRVLGVDPASAGPTGYGIIESDGKVCRVLRYGALEVAAKRRRSSAGVVLREVHELLCELIEEFQPEAMAVESVFTALNMRTALRLAEVRGVVLLAAE